VSNAAKNFNILATNLNVLQNYFDALTELFSSLYLAKFLDTSTKSFFPCKYIANILKISTKYV